MAEKGGFDILFGNIETQLVSYSDAQPVKERYEVQPDSFRALVSGTPGAYVFLTLGPLTPESQANNIHFDYNISYYLDLAVISKGVKSETGYMNADKAAGIRLRYLIQQIILALFTPENRMLGMPKGSFRKKPFFTMQPFPEELQKTEISFTGVRLVLTVGLAFDAQEVPGIDLSRITVSSDDWSAIFDYEPQEE